MTTAVATGMAEISSDILVSPGSFVLLGYFVFLLITIFAAQAVTACSKKGLLGHWRVN
jgi:hypothetical protein